MKNQQEVAPVSLTRQPEASLRPSADVARQDYTIPHANNHRQMRLWQVCRPDFTALNETRQRQLNWR